MSKIKPHLLIILILLLALILRLVFLFHYGNFWDDEMFNIIYSQKAWPLGLKYWLWETNPPLLLLTLKIWFHIFPATEFFARLPSILAGVGTVYITYLFGKDIFHKNIGLLAAFYLAINPYHIFWSDTARAYAILMLFSAWSTWFFFRCYILGKNTPCIRKKSAAINLLLIFSHLSSLFLLFGQFLLIIVLKGKKETICWVKNNLIPFVLGATWIGTSLLLKAGNELGSAWFFNLQYTFTDLLNPLTNILGGLQSLIIGSTLLLLIFFAIGLALYKDIRLSKTTLASLIIIVFIPIILAAIFGVWHIKFIMTVIPLLAIVVVYSLRCLVKNNWIIFFTISAVSALGLYNLWQTLPISDWQNVGQFIADNKTGKTAIVSNNFFLKTQIDYYVPSASPMLVTLETYKGMEWDDMVVKKNYIFKKLDISQKEEWYKINNLDKYTTVILLQDEKNYMNKLNDTLIQHGWHLKKGPTDAKICGDYHLYLYDK